MKTIKSPWKLLGLASCLSGCTTMLAHTTIEPYTKIKQQRNALELLAENYCTEKRTQPGNNQPALLPDYIYTTDGCSRWPDGSWQVCCIVHDIAYWCGGSQQDRQEADEWLKQCANDKSKLMGSTMYPGIRVGGVPWLPTPWRWGYGWENWPQGYENLEQSPAVDVLLEKLNARSIIEKHFKDMPSGLPNPPN